MKLFIATSLLLSAPAALAFTPTYTQASFTATHTPSPTALGYIEDSSVQEAVDMTFIPKEDPALNALASQLDITENSLRSVYAVWLFKYDKTPIEARYATFKKNFLLQEAWNSQNDQNFCLNEYGDNTEEEFEQMRGVVKSLPVVDAAAQMIEQDIKIIQQSVVDVAVLAKEDPVILALATQLKITEGSLRSVYAEWLVKHEKTPTETRYAIFKKNYLLQESWNRKNGQSFCLNEYGDNTAEEYALRGVYEDWLAKYAKTPEETRYAVFINNFLMQEEWNREHGQSFSLNEYGDRTEEEFKQC